MAKFHRDPGCKRGAAGTNVGMITNVTRGAGVVEPAVIGEAARR
jgi:hypothetical protein